MAVPLLVASSYLSLPTVDTTQVGSLESPCLLSYDYVFPAVKHDAYEQAYVEHYGLIDYAA